MLTLKAIGVIGALAVGVLVVSKVVSGASQNDTHVSGGLPFGRGFGIGSAVGGAKAGDTIYNFPAPVFPEMPVYEMPEALVNEIADETAPSKKAVFSQKMGEGQLPMNLPQKVFLDLLSIQKTGAPVGETKKEAVSSKPVGWGAYAPKQPSQPSESTGGMSKKQALLKERDEEEDKDFFGQYSGFFGGR